MGSESSSAGRSMVDICRYGNAGGEYGEVEQCVFCRRSDVRNIKILVEPDFVECLLELRGSRGRRCLYERFLYGGVAVVTPAV